jgi:tol-pal system protein YbgF
VKTYPQSPLSADVQYHIGEHYFHHANYDRARQEYQELEANFGKSPLVADAIYGCAWCDLKERKFPDALGNFRKVMTEFPDRDLAVQSAFWIGNVYYQLHEYDQAIDTFNKFVEAHPDHKLAADARFNKAMAFKRLDLDKEAQQAYQDVIDHYPKTELAFRSQMHIGYMLQDSRQFPAALEAFRQVTLNAPTDMAAEAQFWIADIYESEQENQAAAREYLKLADQYPASNRWAVTALARVAELHEKAGEFEAAIGIYQRVVRTSTDKRARKSAKDRIKLIKEKLAALEAPPATTAEPATPAATEKPKAEGQHE